MVKKRVSEPRKIVFQIHGGLGANILKTATLAELRAENPEAIIHVKASYPDVFKANPDCNQYFAGPPQQVIYGAYENYKDFEFIGEQEPYFDLKYRQKKCHYIDASCRRIGVKPPKKHIGKIILTKKEIKQGKKILQNLKSQLPNIGGKKIIAFQWTGGIPTYNQEKVDEIMPTTQTRSLPKKNAQEIVDLLNKNDYAVLQISLPREEKLNNVMHLTNNQQHLHIRFLFAILNECDGFIGIDSFAQHAWAALGKKNGLVMWGATSPEQLGYDSNLNLTPTNNPCDNIHCGRPFSFVGDYLGNNEPWSCPYEDGCMDYKPAFVVGKFTTLLAENEPKPEEPKV